MREECIWLESGAGSENAGGLRVFFSDLHLRWNGFLPNFERKEGEGENWWDIWIVLFWYDKDIKTYQNNTNQISLPYQSHLNSRRKRVNTIQISLLYSNHTVQIFLSHMKTTWFQEVDKFKIPRLVVLNT